MALPDATAPIPDPLLLEDDGKPHYTGPEQRRTIRILQKWTPVEMQAIRRSALASGIPTWRWVRQRLLGAGTGYPRSAKKLSEILGVDTRDAKVDPWPGDLFQLEPRADRSHTAHYLHVEDVGYYPGWKVTVRWIGHKTEVLVMPWGGWLEYVAPYRVLWAARVRPPIR